MHDPSLVDPRECEPQRIYTDVPHAISTRRLPIGAELLPTGGVHFRLWAPMHSAVEVRLEEGPGSVATLRLESEGREGYFSGIVPGAAAGTRYRFHLEGEDLLLPDPASRFQPAGPHGPSEVVDPSAYRWSDVEWRGVGGEGQVIYELHVGTFTPEGSWRAASDQLAELADLGVSVIELMPVADFPGEFGWGYDGVNLFAPSRLYGTPDDFRAFVDAAHRHGIGVILDVVYNHLGPEGNYLPRFSDHYFTDRYETDWGDPFDFDGPRSAPVREFIVSNASYWIDEFRLDGFRLDATQNIYDAAQGTDHILTEIARVAREAAPGRRVYLVGENEPQDRTMVEPPEQGGHGLDALWNDDYHHSAMVALTGRKEAYYSDYLGVPQEFVSAARWGFLYQGQHYTWQGKRRGTPTFDLPRHIFVSYLQNHDQIANSARGDRVHRLTSPGRLRAITAFTLLGQATPMLFMGQEFAASTPFLYFADHEPELNRKVLEGRRDFLGQFPSLARPDVQGEVGDPADSRTFQQCKLNFQDRGEHADIYALHRDLLRLRREDEVLRPTARGRPEGAVLSDDAFVLRFFGPAGDDRLLLINLGRDLRFTPAPEPLLAPPLGGHWSVLWSSEDLEYGGSGSPEPESEEGEWKVVGEAAIVLASRLVGGGEART